MTIPPKDSRLFRVGERGDLVVPADVLARAGIEAKTHVRFRVEGRRVVIEKAVQEANPLDAPLGRKIDKDLLSKIQIEQQKQRERAREAFEKGLAEAPKDPEPPDNPFRWD